MIGSSPRRLVAALFAAGAAYLSVGVTGVFAQDAQTAIQAALDSNKAADVRTPYRSITDRYQSQQSSPFLNGLSHQREQERVRAWSSREAQVALPDNPAGGPHAPAQTSRKRPISRSGVQREVKPDNRRGSSSGLSDVSPLAGTRSLSSAADAPREANRKPADEGASRAETVSPPVKRGTVRSSERTVTNRSHNGGGVALPPHP